MKFNYFTLSFCWRNRNFWNIMFNIMFVSFNSVFFPCQNFRQICCTIYAVGGRIANENNWHCSLGCWIASPWWKYGGGRQEMQFNSWGCIWNRTFVSFVVADKKRTAYQHLFGMNKNKKTYNMTVATIVHTVFKVWKRTLSPEWKHTVKMHGD